MGLRYRYLQREVGGSDRTAKRVSSRLRGSRAAYYVLTTDCTVLGGQARALPARGIKQRATH